ncbi:hypothetical protein ABWH96_10935 [Marivirga tractuosa]|uniref:hypothetical protein n=1 Tax=Marivirga tractuosa TaxID=1006 RepID=UPI0035D0D952
MIQLNMILNKNILFILILLLLWSCHGEKQQKNCNQEDVLELMYIVEGYKSFSKNLELNEVDSLTKYLLILDEMSTISDIYIYSSGGFKQNTKYFLNPCDKIETIEIENAREKLNSSIKVFLEQKNNSGFESLLRRYFLEEGGYKIFNNNNKDQTVLEIIQRIYIAEIGLYQTLFYEIHKVN